MKKSNPWIAVAIIIGILCVAVISLYVLMLVFNSGGNVAVQEEIETDAAADSTSGNNISLAALPLGGETFFTSVELDEFNAAYSGKIKNKDSSDDDDDEDDKDKEDDDDSDDSDDSDEDYILPESDTKELDESDLDGLSAKDLTYARNEIYARHGRVFNSSELQDYFSSKDWYEKDEEFDDHDLRGVERDNAEFISQYQKDHDLTYKAN